MRTTKNNLSKLNLLKILAVAMLSSCGEPNFYDYSARRQTVRVPMIKPFEMYSYNSGDSWYFDLPTERYTAAHQIDKIKYIGVKDSLIIFYTDELHLPVLNDSITQGWFIVDTETKTEVVFTSEESYKAALDSLKVGNVKLYDINKVFNDFNETNKWPAEWPKEANE